MGLRTGASSYNSSPVTEIVNLKEKSHIFIQFPFNWLDNLNFVQHRQLFISNIQFAAHFIAPWTLLPGQPHESPPALGHWLAPLSTCLCPNSRMQVKTTTRKMGNKSFKGVIKFKYSIFLLEYNSNML
jgi:hypothetical protein